MTVLLATASLVGGAQDPDLNRELDAQLLDAARMPDAARVDALLDRGADVDSRQADGATALHWAAHWDDAAMVKTLIEAGADVDSTNDFGATPLWLSCQNVNADMVAAFLNAGANANAALPSGETVLMTASLTGSAEAVSLLVAHGADMNTRELTRGQTALMWAVAQQHQDVVRILVDLGADVHLRSSSRPRRIHTRTAGFNPTGVVDVVQGGNTALLFAARQGDLSSARHLVAGGADVNDTAPLGTSALVVAVHSGHTTLAIFLLENGADPNAAEAGYNALHAATLRGDEVVARALLAQGADPNAPVVRGSPGRRNSPDYVLEHEMVGATPFWLAAHFGEPGIMQALAERGADAQVVMEGGTTSLMAATRARRRQEPGLAVNPVEDERRVRDAAKVAIDAGVDLNAVDAKGNTALHTAASRQLDTVVQLLAESGANLDVQNADGQTPLALAAGNDTDADADTDTVDNSTVELLRTLGGK